MKKQEKGITLIALVITIIVMLILVAVTINIAINGGLFNYAQAAKSETKVTIEEEQSFINLGNGLSYNQLIAEYVGTPEKFSNIYAQDADFTDRNGKTARIPKGFAVGQSRGINTVTGGLVITDSVAEDGTSNGNEFVWIPVDDISKFTRTGWATDTNTSTEQYLGGNYAEGNGADTMAPYRAMRASVEQWKGFYIARYEAGTTIARVENGTNSVSDTVYSKKLIYPYNFINWTNAKTLSEGMYSDSEHGVTSTLCYGVQWDSTMRFIKDIKNVSNSTTWGNYYNNEFDYEGKYYSEASSRWLTAETTKKSAETSMLLQTGACAENQAKNIYDLAGNVRELTMEQNRTYYVWRSGTYSSNGNVNPASCRSICDKNLSYKDLGFRVALYVSSLT